MVLEEGGEVDRELTSQDVRVDLGSYERISITSPRILEKDGRIARISITTPGVRIDLRSYERYSQDIGSASSNETDQSRRNEHLARPRCRPDSRWVSYFVAFREVSRGLSHQTGRFFAFREVVRGLSHQTGRFFAFREVVRGLSHQTGRFFAFHEVVRGSSHQTGRFFAYREVVRGLSHHPGRFFVRQPPSTRAHPPPSPTFHKSSPGRWVKGGRAAERCGHEAEGRACP